MWNNQILKCFAALAYSVLVVNHVNSFKLKTFDLQKQQKWMNQIKKQISTQSILLFASTILCTNQYSIQLVNAAESSQPPAYGLKKGRLLACKTQSNCISSSSINSLDKYGRPWSFIKSPDDEYTELKNFIKNDKFLSLIDNDSDEIIRNNKDSKYYLHATAKSAVPPTGTDDVEFLINPLDKIITYRSNSRDVLMAGFSQVGDGNSNLNRLDSIRRQLGLSEMQQSVEADEYVKEVSNMALLSQMKLMSEPNDINFIDNSVPINNNNPNTNIPTNNDQLIPSAAINTIDDTKPL